MDFRQNTAIIYSEETRKILIDKALAEGKVYRFDGAEGKKSWLVGKYAYLAANALSNILRRLGISFDVLSENEIRDDILEFYDTVFLPNAAHLSESALSLIYKWCGDNNHKLIVSGDTNLPDLFLGVGHRKRVVASDYCGIPEFVFCPPDYTMNFCLKNGKAQGFEKVVSFQKNNQAWEMEKTDYDAIIINQNVLYVTFSVFEYFGALFQGHLDIKPIYEILPSKRCFYLDLATIFLKKLFKKIGIKESCKIEIDSVDLRKNIMILKHDVDYSRNLEYLKFELENHIPATFAILVDKNKDFWLSNIPENDFIEKSYHFPANLRGKLNNITHILKLDFNKILTIKKNLYHQVKSAKNHGIPINTIHRHGSKFYYPETVDGLGYLYRQLPEIKGSMTMFRFSNFQFSKSEFSKNYTIEHPDVSVPFWFPFKLKEASIESKEEIRGWEMGQFIEPDIKHINSVFDSSRSLPGIFSFDFHPAHAKTDTFNPGGNFKWFEYAVKRARENHWLILNYRDVCQRLDERENLKIRRERDKISIYNSGDEPICKINIVVDNKRYFINEIEPNQILHYGE